MTNYVNNKNPNPQNPLYRGDCYDWCRVLSNNTLEFGNEQGNYAGGTNLSYTFYGSPRDLYPNNHEPTEEYWKEVNRKLDFYKDTDPEFYEKIIAMAREHDIKEVL